MNNDSEFHQNNSFSFNNDKEIGEILYNNLDFEKPHQEINKFSSIIHTYGGEPSSPPNNNYQHGNQFNSQSRNSRPGSSQSINYGGPSRGFINNNSLSGFSGGGSGGGGNGQQNEILLTNDSNRQIILILLRLQQDTNNVLTRLSYLEATVLSLQNNLQMNRIENSIQLNNQVSSAFSLVPQNRSVSDTRDPMSIILNIFKNIDWKTFAIAIIWPFIIRLVFYLLRKVKFKFGIRLKKVEIQSPANF